MSEAGQAAVAPAETVEQEQAASPAAQSVPEWASGFDESTVGYIQNKGWESPEQLLQSYRSLEKFQGGSKDLVEVPGVDANPEEMNAFYDRLGRPASAADYGLELPEGGDENMMNWFAETAHRYGLSQKQTQALFNEYNEMGASVMRQAEHDLGLKAEEDIGMLKKEWGADYDRMVDAGRLAANGLGYGAEELSALEAKMGTADMMKLFATIGQKIGEDNFVSGEGSQGLYAVTSPSGGTD